MSPHKDMFSNIHTNVYQAILRKLSPSPKFYEEFSENLRKTKTKTKNLF